MKHVMLLSKHVLSDDRYMAQAHTKRHWLLFKSWEIVSIVPWHLIEEVETIILCGCFTV
jgi:hypothetical protein